MNRIEVIDMTPGDLGIPFIFSYLVKVSNSSLLVVESGPQATINRLSHKIREMIENGVQEVHIFITHIHLDHGGGVGGLAGTLEDKKDVLRIYVHPRGYKHLINPSRLWDASRQALGWLAEVYQKPIPVPEEILVETKDGMTISLGDYKAIVVHTPGHASHHQSLLLNLGNEKILFTGDSMGMYSPKADAVVPTTPPPFRYSQYIESIEKQARYSPTKLAFTHTGFGEAKLIDRHLKQTKLWYEIIRKEVEQGNKDPEKILSVLVENDQDVKKYLEATGFVELVRLLINASIEGFVENILGSK